MLNVFSFVSIFVSLLVCTLLKLLIVPVTFAVLHTAVIVMSEAFPGIPVFCHIF